MGKRFRIKKSLVKNAADAFPQCPRCESPKLIRFEGEAICEYCDWNSVELRVEARLGMQARRARVSTIEDLADQEYRAALRAEELIADYVA